MPQADKSTLLSPSEEKDFQQWYSYISKILQIDPDPDHPLHYYDFRRAYKQGFDPISPDNPSRHWPSEFKYSGHPREYLYDPNQHDIFNTTSGEHGFFVGKQFKPKAGD